MASSESTCWTVLHAAAGGNDAAREEFARRYAPLVRAYLAAWWRGSPLVGEVDDAVQDVFVECLRDGGMLERAEPGRSGGFRAFLYGLVRNVALRFETKRARRRVVGLGCALMLAGVLGAIGFYRAERHRWKAEHAEQLRLESALAVLVPMEGKTRYLLEHSASAKSQDAVHWADLLASCRRVAEQAAATAPDDDTREWYEKLVRELSRQEAALRERIEGHSRPENPARNAAGP